MKVRFNWNGGQLTPVKGKVTGRHYGYRKAGEEFSIEEADFDQRFIKLEDEAPSTDVPLPTTPDALLGEVKVGLTKAQVETLKKAGATHLSSLLILSAADLAVMLNVSEEKATEILKAAQEVQYGL